MAIAIDITNQPKNNKRLIWRQTCYWENIKNMLRFQPPSSFRYHHRRKIEIFWSMELNIWTGGHHYSISQSARFPFIFFVERRREAHIRYWTSLFSYNSKVHFWAASHHYSSSILQSARFLRWKEERSSYQILHPPLHRQFIKCKCTSFIILHSVLLQKYTTKCSYCKCLFS